jgi:hypothetical protein
MYLSFCDDKAKGVVTKAKSNLDIPVVKMDIHNAYQYFSIAPDMVLIELVEQPDNMNLIKVEMRAITDILNYGSIAKDTSHEDSEILSNVYVLKIVGHNFWISLSHA